MARYDQGGSGPALAAKSAAANAAAAKAAAAKIAAARAAAASKRSGGGGTTHSTGGGSRATGGAASTTSTSTAGDQSTQAANFGWSLAVINSNPELKALFAQATSTGPGGGWTTDHFVAKVRDTKWFKTNADTARQAIILQKADPATYAARLNQAMAQARAMVGDTGARMTTAQFNKIATDTLMFGWNTEQLRQNMASFVTAGTGGQYAGGAAAHQFQYAQLAEQYGQSIDPVRMGQLIRGAVNGTVTGDSVRNDMIARASSRFPALASRLAAGETVQQIADPYIQSYAKVLEVNPNTVNLSDSLVQSALSGTDAKGQPSTKTVWAFENDLRSDPRYMKTQGAQDASMGMAHKVLQDWGIKS